MPVLERLSNLDLDDLISCQPESTENMTDADSEKAALCSLRDKHDSTQYGLSQLVGKLGEPWRGAAQDLLVLTTFLSLSSCLLLRALECTQPGFRPSPAAWWLWAPYLTSFQSHVLHLKNGNTIVLFRIMKIKQDKPSQVKSLTVSSTWELRECLWSLFQELSTRWAQSSLPGVFPSHLCQLVTNLY